MTPKQEAELLARYREQSIFNGLRAARERLQQTLAELANAWVVVDAIETALGLEQDERASAIVPDNDQISAMECAVERVRVTEGAGSKVSRHTYGDR